jgi:hypothetical protein
VGVAISLAGHCAGHCERALTGILWMQCVIFTYLQKKQFDPMSKHSLFYMKPPPLPGGRVCTVGQDLACTIAPKNSEGEESSNSAIQQAPKKEL